MAARAASARMSRYMRNGSLNTATESFPSSRTRAEEVQGLLFVPQPFGINHAAALALLAEQPGKVLYGGVLDAWCLRPCTITVTAAHSSAVRSFFQAMTCWCVARSCARAAAPQFAITSGREARQ